MPGIRKERPVARRRVVDAGHARDFYAAIAFQPAAQLLRHFLQLHGLTPSDTQCLTCESRTAHSAKYRARRERFFSLRKSSSTSAERGNWRIATMRNRWPAIR